MKISDKGTLSLLQTDEIRHKYAEKTDKLEIKVFCHNIPGCININKCRFCAEKCKRNLDLIEYYRKEGFTLI